MTELNERQMALYEYMIKQSKNCEEINRFILMGDLDKWYRRKSEQCPITNSAAYRTLRADIEAINKSTAQYVILSILKSGKIYGYKLATSTDEIMKQADKLSVEALRLLQKAALLRKKAKNNGQVRFASDDVKEIRSEYGNKMD